MNTAMIQKGLKESFAQITREVTEWAAGICLCQGDSFPAGDLCTVYVAFERGIQTSVSFCAEASLFMRLTRYLLQAEELTFQDVEDSSKEYFNILCGYFAAQMFQMTKVPLRFGIPVFYPGRYVPEGYEEEFVICYTSDRNENAQLIYYTPRIVV